MSSGKDCKIEKFFQGHFLLWATVLSRRKKIILPIINLHANCFFYPLIIKSTCSFPFQSFQLVVSKVETIPMLLICVLPKRKQLSAFPSHAQRFSSPSRFGFPGVWGERDGYHVNALSLCPSLPASSNAKADILSSDHSGSWANWKSTSAASVPLSRLGDQLN